LIISHWGTCQFNQIQLEDNVGKWNWCKNLILRLSIKNAEDRAKYYIDKKKSHCRFEVGNKVILKVTHQRSRLKLDNSRNLSLQFCSPFEIIKQIGLVAYELNMFSSWKIQNVFMWVCCGFIFRINPSTLPKAFVKIYFVDAAYQLLVSSLVCK